MSPRRFRKIRLALDLSIKGMADALMMSPKSGKGQIMKYEQGRASIPGPTALAMEYMMEHGLPEHQIWSPDAFQ